MVGKPQVKVGFAAPLASDQAIASVGAPMRQCAALAVTQANERRDLPFALIPQAEDDCADPVTTQAAAHRLAANPAVIGVVGHKNSGAAAVAAPIYNAASLTKITPSSPNSQLSQQGCRTFSVYAPMPWVRLQSISLLKKPIEYRRTSSHRREELDNA